MANDFPEEATKDDSCTILMQQKTFQSSIDPFEALSLVQKLTRFLTENGFPAEFLKAFNEFLYVQYSEESKTSEYLEKDLVFFRNEILRRIHLVGG